MTVRRFSKYLHSADILCIGFAALLSLINIVFASRISFWWQMVLINIGVTVLILVQAYLRHTTGWKILALMQDWYVPPTVFLSFKELYFIIKPIHLGRDYDDVLIAIDRWLFGVDPTHWLMRFANPPLTEILQIAYNLFYVLFLVVGFELYRRHNPRLFHYFLFTVVYGFFLSYLGYLLLPAVGPRFTLHDFSAIDRDLPGVWLTPMLRWFVNVGESIPMDVSNAAAQAVAQRDVFPSGHTMMTLVLMFLSWQHRVGVRWFVWITGVLLIAATVYERYHYAVDLIGGVIFMILCVATAKPLYDYLTDHFETMESRFPD